MAITYLTIPHLSTKELTRIFSKIRISETSSYQGARCWEWTSTLNKGYGYISWRRFRSPVAAYRFLYAWLVEPLPSRASKKEIDHLCKNTRCVNPVHLELVPGFVNNMRSDNPCAQHARKTHCKNGHPLEGDNLDPRHLPKRRYCLTCRRQWDRTKRTRPNQAAYNKEYRRQHAEKLRESSKERRTKPEYNVYMQEYLKEYRRTHKRKPLTPEQRARKNELTREHRRKYGRSDRPKKSRP